MPSGPVMKTCQPSFARVRPLAIATTTLNRIVVVTSSPLDACTMKVTATFLCNARFRSMDHDPESAKRLPGNRAQRDLSVILWISRSTRFHVLAISVPAPQHARGRSSRSSVMLCCFKSRPAPTVRNELSNRLLWIIRSGNLPGPAFQPHRPRDETGSRRPTI